MSAILHEFHFIHPWWLLALALLPFVWWLGRRAADVPRQLARLVDAELLPHVVHGRARRLRTPPLMAALAWVLAVLALAGPTWSRSSEPLFAERPAQVVAISLSRHMLARDVPPRRLDRALEKARDLLASNRDGQNALIGYAGAAFVVAPLTADAHSLDDLLAAMAPDTMPVDGNDAALAIGRGVALIRAADAGGGSIVVITDQADAAADAAARAAAGAGVHVSVLGIGTPSGGPIPLPGGGFLRDAQGQTVLAPRDDAALARLAAAGGGRYVAMSTDGRDVATLHAAQGTAGQTATATRQTTETWQDRGPWLLLPLLLVAALAFRRGWLFALALVCLPLLPAPAQAMDWQDLWRRPDQQAALALRQGDAQKAEQVARDPAWRGVAAYRARNYAAAVRALGSTPGTDGAYNLGNALAAGRHYEQALAAYDQALKLDPGNADARANRKAIEDWLRQHDQDRQSGKPGKSGQSGARDKSQSADGNSEASQGEGKSGEGANGAQHDADAGQAPPTQKPSADAGSGTPPPQTVGQQAAQKADAARAEEALRRQMDQALGKAGPDAPAAAHQLGEPAKDDPQSKLPANLRNALQRVPDDPGALLRRKFALEYQERMRAGRDGGQQP